jgi:hypothetical protein
MRVITAIGSGRAACIRCKKKVPKDEPCVQIIYYGLDKKLRRSCIQEIRDELFNDSDNVRGSVGQCDVSTKS